MPNATATESTNSTPFYTSIDSPIGKLLLVGDDHALHGLYMQEGKRPVSPHPDWVSSAKAFAGISRQLEEYFAGERTDFDVELSMHGTDFQQTVWRELQNIPYGQTISYGELAHRIEKPWAARAVGLANGANPIAVIVPCHRVIGADGTLTGYGGGLERKRILLSLEGSLLEPEQLVIGG